MCFFESRGLAENYKLMSTMTQQTKRKLKRVLWSVFACLFGGLLLLIVVVVIKLERHMPTMAYDSLAAALERSDRQELMNLSTPRGFKQLQNMFSLYGEKPLGRYLTNQKPVKPYFHAPGTAAVLLGKSKDFDTVIFFGWTWNGWKLVGISGTPTLQPHQKKTHNN